VASQKAAEAATAAAQTASTLPAAPRAALARRNGEGDGGHLSSGLLQVRARAGLWRRMAGPTQPSALPPISPTYPPST
jgi:hypothetical protein